MPARSSLVGLTAALLVGGAAVARAEPVDLELVLAADGSGSIDDGEMRLQRQGYADAITDPEVLQAIASGFLGKIAVTYIEWGGATSQHVIVDWSVIDGPESAKLFADRLVTTPRAATGWNSIANAIAFSHKLMDENVHEGTRRIIDVSADSGNYGGMPLPLARQAALDADITINGLAILCRACNGRPTSGDLEGHFRRDIIGGFGAFVVTVDDTTSFPEAVRKKLLLEIAQPMPGSHEPPG
jgi:hypothetical protein